MSGALIKDLNVRSDFKLSFSISNAFYEPLKTLQICSVIYSLFLITLKYAVFFMNIKSIVNTKS